jgi:hypothetical protein
MYIRYAQGQGIAHGCSTCKRTDELVGRQDGWTSMSNTVWGYNHELSSRYGSCRPRRGLPVVVAMSLAVSRQLEPRGWRCTGGIRDCVLGDGRVSQGSRACSAGFSVFSACVAPLGPALSPPVPLYGSRGCRALVFRLLAGACLPYRQSWWSVEVPECSVRSWRCRAAAPGLFSCFLIVDGFMITFRISLFLGIPALEPPSPSWRGL